MGYNYCITHKNIIDVRSNNYKKINARKNLDHK